MSPITRKTAESTLNSVVLLTTVRNSVADCRTNVGDALRIATDKLSGSKFGTSSVKALANEFQVALDTLAGVSGNDLAQFQRGVKALVPRLMEELVQDLAQASDASTLAQNAARSLCPAE